MKKTDKPIADQHHQTFEGIRQFDAEGNEYWTARQLARVLEYSEYRHFLPVIERAREACRNSGHPEADHFEDVLDMVEIGSGAKRQVPDVHLATRWRPVSNSAINPALRFAFVAISCSVFWMAVSQVAIALAT